MPINPRNITEANYELIRYQLIKDFEESGNENPSVYTDSEGYVSTGIGFNLEELSIATNVIKVVS